MNAPPDTICFLVRVVSRGLAIAGVIGVALLVGRILPVAGETAEWAQYLALGAITPIGVLFLSRFTSARWTASAFSLIGTLAALAYVACSGRWIAAPIAIVQVLLAATIAGRRPVLREFVVAAFAWAAVAALA